MQGDGKGLEKCLMPGDEATTTLTGQASKHPRIAAQCCTASDTCARSHNGKCIAGNSKMLDGEIKLFTYGAWRAEQKGAERVQRCEQRCEEV